jgi:RNA polymerase sigma-70 factor, ECF subfamily
MMSRFRQATSGAALSLDNELTRLRDGDVQAMGPLMERYQHRLYRYLLRLVWQPGTAEDLFQQTWLRVMEKIRTYDPNRNFESWLFTVARNLALDHLRRYQPESLDEPLPSGDTRMDLTAGSGPGALDHLLAQERFAWLVQALAELPPVFREVLTLRFEEEMKMEEMAVVLGVPLGTVKTRLHRAMKHLRARLENKMETRN